MNSKPTLRRRRIHRKIRLPTEQSYLPTRRAPRILPQAQSLSTETETNGSPTAERVQDQEEFQEEAPREEEDDEETTAEETAGSAEANGMAEASSAETRAPEREGSEDVPKQKSSGARANGRGRGQRTFSGKEKIGEILSEEGKVTEEQLQHARETQEEDPRDIGEILLSLGYVSRADLMWATAQRLNLEFIELRDTDVDRSLLTIVDQKVLRKHTVMPLRLEDEELYVAMSNPKDLHALEDLRMLTGYKVTPVVATPDDIRRVQNKLVSLGEGVSEFLEEASSEGGSEDDEEIQLGVGAGEDEAPIIRLVSSILQQAVGEEASDIHIEPQAQEVKVRFRVDGVLREIMSVPKKIAKRSGGPAQGRRRPEHSGASRAARRPFQRQDKRQQDRPPGGYPTDGLW